MILNTLLLFQDTASNVPTICFGCLFWWSLLPFLLGGLIGYWIWGKYKRLASDRESQILVLKRQLKKEEKEKVEVLQRLETANAISNKLKANLADSAAEKAAINRKLRSAEVRIVDYEEQIKLFEEAVAKEEETEKDVIEIVEEKETEENMPGILVESDEGEIEEKEEEIIATTEINPLAAVAVMPQDKEDDYLPCAAYRGHPINDKLNNIAFFKHENGQYYFALYDEDGAVKLRSEGFPTALARDKELSGVVRLKEDENFYTRIAKGDYYMDVLCDETGREVGRSCLQKIELAPSEVVEEIMTGEVITDTEQAISEPSEAKPTGETLENIAVTAPEADVVERQIIRVRRTVNLSGLEDLDGISISAQTKLRSLGYSSMTALAAADEATLASQLKDTGLNWRYWWKQSKYAIAGDWAAYYAYQESKGETTDEGVVSENTTTTFIEEEVASTTTMAAPTETDERVHYAAYFTSDNLKIIEGVGPKIEKILKDAGYDTWASLAVASYDDLKKMLSNAGPRYRIHDPKSWSKQAELANDGKWEDLITFQKFLNQSGTEGGAYSKLEKLMDRHLGFSKATESDLKIIEGIGPKIENLLKAAGINNWGDLSRASNDKLKLILQNAGTRFRLADPTTWPTQAGMAVRKEWVKLKEYQDMLQGGKDIAV